MKPVSICYLPGPNFPGAESCYANLRAWRTRGPLILFSEHKWDEQTVLLQASPEILVGSSRHAKSNLVFLTALRILRAAFPDTTHFMYLESDCRVAQHEWDYMVFEECFIDGQRPLMAGSIVCHNMSSLSMRWTRLWTEFITKNSLSRFPITCYGAIGAAEPGVPCMFLNGALGVYDLPLLLKFFAPQLADGQTTTAAVEMAAWDVAIGRHFYDTFGEDIFDGRVKHLNSVYSSYGDVQTTEKERLEMLVTGQAVAVHQVKGSATGPMSEKDLNLEAGGVEADASALPEAASGGGHALNESVRIGEIQERSHLTESRRLETDGVAPVPASIPSMDIFIVSYAKDAEWLLYCLRSIKKFCHGFNAVVIATPEQDTAAFAPHRAVFPDYIYLEYDESPPPLGFLHHMVTVCRADDHCASDFILHCDSDCVFHIPTTPADYLVGGKAVLQIEPYEHLKTAHPGRFRWKAVVDEALGGDATHETMTRHPGVFPRELYPLVRAHIEQKHGKPFDDYVMACKATFPHGFCEFATLGAYAMKSASMRERFHFVEGTQQGDENVFVTTSGITAPKNHILQGHSHPKGKKDNLDNPHDYGPSVPASVNSHRKLAHYLSLV